VLVDVKSEPFYYLHVSSVLVVLRSDDFLVTSLGAWIRGEENVMVDWVTKCHGRSVRPVNHS
jgi:hypothetical protein